MSDIIQQPNTAEKSPWENRRDKAIARLIRAIVDDREGEAATLALNAVVVAHLAATFECDYGIHQRWKEYETNASDRFLEAWIKYEVSRRRAGSPHGDPDAENALYAALDLLAVAYIATTFEWASGPLKWRS